MSSGGISLEFPNGRYLRFNFRHQFTRAVLSPSGSRSQTAAAPVQVRLDSSRPVNYYLYALFPLSLGSWHVHFADELKKRSTHYLLPHRCTRRDDTLLLISLGAACRGGDAGTDSPTYARRRLAICRRVQVRSVFEALSSTRSWRSEGG